MSAIRPIIQMPLISELHPCQPRRFLAERVNFGDWSQVALYFDRLEVRATHCLTAGDLEAWLLDWSELSAAIAEDFGRRYIAMTGDLNDEIFRQSYLDVVEQVHPKMQPREFRLAQIFQGHPLRSSLPKHRYEVLDRNVTALVELFHEDNVPLEIEDAKLVQDDIRVTSAMQVSFRGQDFTLPEMNKFLEEPNRQTRQEAWELVAQRTLQDADKREGSFEAMLRCRARMAANAGFANYRDYGWQRLRRFDYSPNHCANFHLAIEREVLPVVCELQEERRRKLGVDTLRPWDMDVDPYGSPRLKPFTNVADLLEGIQRVFDRLDGELADGFRRIQDLNLLDLENRKGKAPGGYQLALSESRMPFIFLNAVGVHMDVLMLLHEAGHAFHTLAARTEPLLSYRTAPIEFCEVASLSMELIGGEHLSEFYSPDDARRARRAHLEAVLTSLPWIATVDVFQQWVYSHPGHTRAERTGVWTRLTERFGGLVDWSAYEQYRAILWHDVTHVFQSPLYFVEYGIAWLGALQVWSNWKQNQQAGMAAYKRALAFGGSRPLTELFATAGARFDFDGKTLPRLIRLLQDELEDLSSS